MSEQVRFSQRLAGFLTARAVREGCLAEKEKNVVAAVVERLVESLARGHSCIVLSGKELRSITGSGLAGTDEFAVRPLMVWGDRLYLHRYYSYERMIVKKIGELAESSEETQETAGWSEMVSRLDHYFPVAVGSSPEDDDQRRAAMLALSKPLAIIVGGPGTGKTTTVVKILGLLVERYGAGCRIGLAAPTGKAAGRLTESLKRSCDGLGMADLAEKTLPLEAKTIHRMLGVRRNSPRFHHNRENPLPYDIVVVDEASMIDLPLMAKLMDSLGAGSRLILLGDRDQLASIESGSVLADLTMSLVENTSHLRKTYRFDGNIKCLSQAVNRGDGDAVLGLFTDSGRANISMRDDLDFYELAGQWREFMDAVVGCSRQPKVAGEMLADLFRHLRKFQILCAVHYGERGVEGVNRGIEREFLRRGYVCQADSWYPGRPVLIQENDYNLHLYNGDVGICLVDPEDGRPKVWFETTEGPPKAIAPTLLGRCETCWGMTIHKSQGSEFENVVVVLPREENQVLSRELVYTGITRAKRSVTLVGDPEILATALRRRTLRTSGLSAMLRSEKNGKY